MKKKSSNTKKVRSPFFADWRTKAKKIAIVVLLVALSFIAAQVVMAALYFALSFLGVPFGEVNPNIINFTFAALTYALSIGLIVAIPWWIRRRRSSLEDFGLSRLPSWMDIGLSGAGFIVYLLATAIFSAIALQLLPFIDPTQPQNVGFEDIGNYYELALAFITLVIIAPFAEEVLFRGYLFGKLRGYVSFWSAALITSALFALAHGQWNVALDTFVLGMVLAWLRDITGSIWAGVLIHALKNGVAFYLLFVNPSLLNTMGVL